MRRLLPFAGIFLLAAALVAQADDLRTLKGNVNGSLEKITDKEITLKTATGSVATPMAQTLELNVRPGKTLPDGKYLEVVLLDDSVLRCTKVKFGAKEVELSLTSGASIKVPVSSLVTVLRDAEDVVIRKRWTGLLKDRTRNDRIFLLSGGDLAPLEGSLGAIDEANQTIYFKTGSKEIEPKLDKLQGLQFVRVEVPAAQALCKIIDTDGNSLVASKLAYDGAMLNLTTPFGAKVALDYKAVAKIDFNFGKLIYLSDLDAKIPEAVLLGGFNPVRKDANLDGYPIMLQDKKYDKGLSMYAGTELEYQLGGKYREFKAILGVDSRIAEEGQGKVTVTIYCNGQKAISKEVSTKAPTPLAVNVKDVDTLRIVVSGSNFTNYDGHATLANAHVSQ